MALEEGVALSFAPGVTQDAYADYARTSEHNFDPLSIAAPELSARTGITFKQKCALSAFALCIIVLSLAFQNITMAVVGVVAAMLFTALIALRWAAALVTHGRNFVAAPPDILPVYSILCPVYREAEALPGLITALDRLLYPHQLLDVIVLVEKDDEPTRDAAAHAASLRPWLRVVAAPPQGPRTKPKALNAGLAIARGDLLVVFDAEDRPHPDQLLAAANAFATGGATLACVQAPLRAYNRSESWIAGQFALEYSVQFGRLLPLFAKLGWPLLLGGTSNHFRTDILRRSHGWDSYNVTEDADLGLRLARAGYQTGVIAPPTYEEAPISLHAWRRQRTRWIKGHLMTWLVHMRRPTLMLRELGAWRFLGAQLTLGGGLLSSFAHGPLLLLAIWATTHGGKFDVAWLFAAAGYAGAFICALSAARSDGQSLSLSTALTAPLYWPLHSCAACLALIELIAAPHRWTKTEHGLTKANADLLIAP